MSARPVLFSGPMVRAILAGAKTQTRRPIGLPTLKPSSTPGYDWTFRGIGGARTVARHQRHPRGCWQDLRAADFLKLCPFGAPGDDLWVRETWACLDSKARPGCRLAYRADTIDGERVRVDAPWRPSIHMPRWASRLTLRVTSVRVEELHAITDADARAEGAPKAFTVRDGGDSSHRAGFCNLWSEVYGRTSWDANPLVWVVSFDRDGSAS